MVSDPKESEDIVVTKERNRQMQKGNLRAFE